jgi:spore coat assembly protein SafA
LRIHIVQKGDTLWKIAQKYGVDFQELLKLNSHLPDPNMIMPGMKIKIPASGGSGIKKDSAKPVKEAPIQKEAPIAEHPFKDQKPPTISIQQPMKEKPKEAPIEPVKEKPKPHFIPKIPQPIIPEIDVNNYYMINMAKMQMEQPQPVYPMPPVFQMPPVPELPKMQPAKEKPVKEKPKKEEPKKEKPKMPEPLPPKPMPPVFMPCVPMTPVLPGPGFPCWPCLPCWPCGPAFQPPVPPGMGFPAAAMPLSVPGSFSGSEHSPYGQSSMGSIGGWEPSQPDADMEQGTGMMGMPESPYPFSPPAGGCGCGGEAISGLAGHPQSGIYPGFVPYGGFPPGQPMGVPFPQGMPPYGMTGEWLPGSGMPRDEEEYERDGEEEL